jgi:hypothetical protein
VLTDGVEDQNEGQAVQDTRVEFGIIISKPIRSESVTDGRL